MACQLSLIGLYVTQQQKNCDLLLKYTKSLHSTCYVVHKQNACKERELSHILDACIPLQFSLDFQVHLPLRSNHKFQVSIACFRGSLLKISASFISVGWRDITTYFPCLQEPIHDRISRNVSSALSSLWLSIIILHLVFHYIDWKGSIFLLESLPWTCIINIQKE